MPGRERTKRLASEQAKLLDLVRRLSDFRSAGPASDELRLLSASPLLAEAEQCLREMAAIWEDSRQRDSLLRMATQLTRLGAWSVELPSMELIWSDEVRAIHEVGPDFRPVVENAMHFYDPECRPQIQAAFQACIEDGTPYSIEVRLRTATGKSVWAHAIGEAVRDASGTITRVHGAFQDISDRKEAQERDWESSLRLNATMESIRDGFVTLDKDWRFLYVNKEAERMLLRPRGELLGQTIWEEFPEVVGSTFEREYRAAVEQQQTREFEDYYPPLGLWLGVRIHPSKEGLALHFRDTTAGRDAREALAESEERFRLLSKATNDAIWDWNLSTDALWWNEGFETLFGYRRGQVSAHIGTWSDNIHAEDRERVVTSIRKVIAGESDQWSDVYRFVRHDGSIAEVADRGHVLRDRQGKGVRMIGGMNDLTESKLGATRLVEQAALLDQASDAILVFGTDCRVILWYKGAESVYGWQASEVFGQPIDQILGVEPESFLLAQRQVLDLEEWSGESVHHTKDGRALAILARWTLVRDEQGRPASILAIHTDITERKKLEEQFLRAQRLESIGTLAGGLAHDLNNLLAPILLASDMLGEFIVDEEGLSVLATVTTSAKRGADLIKRVLGFARGDDGARRPLDPGLALEEIGQVVRDTFPRNITLIVDTPSDLWPVQADPTQLHQVLLNLCVNARDAMPCGGKLTLSVQNVMVDDQLVQARGVDFPHGPYVCILAQDTGTGMTPQVSERIFEPFFTTKGVGAGTGLGLSTTFSIVRAHGGFIQLYSEPGHGTCFQVYLPARPLDAAVVDKKDGPSLPRGEGELVLLVDDEPSVRKMTQKILERNGYRVMMAENGAEALTRYEENRSDVVVVLTDLSMPIMDGPAMIVALRALDSTLPIVGSSGLHTDANVARATLAGMEHFLPKPYNAEALLKTLKQALETAAPALVTPSVCAVAPALNDKPAAKSETSPCEGATVLVVDDLPEQTTLARRILQRAGYVVLTAQSGGEALLIIDSLEGAIDLLITDLRMPGMRGPELAQDVQKRYPEVRVLFVTGGNLDAVLPLGVPLLGKPYSSRTLLEMARRALETRP